MDNLSISSIFAQEMLSQERIDTSLIGNYSIEKSTRAFLKVAHKNHGLQIYDLPIKEARNVLIRAQTGDYEKLPADIEEMTITENGREISIRIVKPKEAKEPLPVLMYFHGGGWVLGNSFTHDRLVRELAVGANVAVVFVNYTPAPEAVYPTANREAYAATAWIKKNGQTLGLNTAKIGVAGDGAGGNMVIAVTLMAKEQRGPKIDFQVMFYPATDDNYNTSSYQQYANGHFLSLNAMVWFWDAYTPDKSVRGEITVTPLNATLDELKGLPEALVITAENDVLRDEGEAYAKKLNAAGVRVTTTRYIGAIHDFVMLNALANTPAARAAVKQACAAIKEKLH